VATIAFEIAMFTGQARSDQLFELFSSHEYTGHARKKLAPQLRIL
jgi:hypothetical protein